MNASSIFEKVAGEKKDRIRRVRQRVNQGWLRAASSIKMNSEDCFTDIIYKDINK